ncbi:cytochrome c peroxidase [Sphingobium sufflavum]|uniref:cytochrome c peroxidase n=1 Tax=Sphingobium sufflavum TaxID=1129547 RepID=UPI002DD426DB|nr:cytochrome c peroxidase [Sphingobium sufflavum]
MGITAPPVPADNGMTAARVELGRRLFYDADLSVDGTMACSACHEQKRAFADGNRTRPGVHGDPGRRNVQGLANVGWLAPLTWADPRQTTLEMQLLVPLLGEHPVEMGMKGQEAEIAARLSRDPCYVRQFAKAFPKERGAIGMATVAKAIAAFERTLISFGSPYDRGALSDEARRGAALFAPACAGCHAGPHFTDGAFHRLEAPVAGERGLGEATGRVEDDGRFRTPGLRNVALTAPYFHDGLSGGLAEAIDRHRLGIVGTDRAAIISFLEALTDQDFVTDPRLSMPDRACGRRL